MLTNRMKKQSAEPILCRGVFGLFLLAVASTLLLGACASSPPNDVAEAVVTPPPPSIEVYFYPTKGQSKAQQDRDRYECYLWAKQQTGFDPSAPQLAPHQRVIVEPRPPAGQDAKASAIFGAILGAATAERGEETEGAVKGAITGAIIGGLSDEARRKEAERLQKQQQQLEDQRAAGIEQQASNYRRAMAACLKGRGYEVR